jgi:hypothetical protein
MQSHLERRQSQAWLRPDPPQAEAPPGISARSRAGRSLIGDWFAVAVSRAAGCGALRTAARVRRARDHQIGDRVKLKLLFASTVLVCVATVTGGVAGASAARPWGSTPSCIPKITQVKGHEQVAYCGPATATVKVGSKTYNYEDGYCSTDTKNHIALQVIIGVISEVKSPVNNGQPLFQMSVLKADGINIDTVTADYSGKSLESVGTVKVSGSIPSGGTFKSEGFSSSFSGSWNCHGEIVTTP